MTSWAVLRYPASGIPVARLLVLQNDDIFTMDPENGRVTMRERLSEIAKVSWDRRTDELFRLVFKNERTLHDSVYVFLSSERNHVVHALVHRMKRFVSAPSGSGASAMDTAPPPPGLDSRVEFIVQGVDVDGGVHAHVLSLDATGIAHSDARLRSVFSRHTYTDVDALDCDDDTDPLFFTLRYRNDAPYQFNIFARDKARLTTYVRGRAHLHQRVMAAGLDRVPMGDQEAARSGWPDRSSPLDTGSGFGPGSSGTPSLGGGVAGGTGTGTAGVGLAGTSPEAGPSPLPSEPELLDFISRGGMLTKHTKEGRGRPHQRYFVVDVQKGELRWGPSATTLEPTRWRLMGVSDGPSPRVSARAVPHSFSVTVQSPRGEQRVLDLIASDELVHNCWTRALRLVLMAKAAGH